MVPIIDLGSGSGTILIGAAQMGAHALGVECNPFFVWHTRLRARMLGLKNNITVIRGNLENFPLGESDVIFFYLSPRAARLIQERLSTEVRAGTRVISNAFPLPDWTPVKKEKGVYLYHVK